VVDPRTLGQIVNRVQDLVHSAPGEWGKLIRHSANGKNSLFELDLGMAGRYSPS
jgi:hypothetical protein